MHTTRMTQRALAALSATCALSLSGAASAADEPSNLGHLPGSPASAQASAVDQSAGMLTGSAYPLDYCLVTDEELGEDGPVVLFNYEGRDIRFCCTDCIADFKAAPAKYIAKLDAAIIEQQKGSYAADKCPISEEALDSMGGPEWIVVGNTLIGLCCGGCEADVRAEPQKFIDWINGLAIEKQKATYQATTCPVTGEDLGEGAVDYVYAGKLVRFCCEDCIADFEKDPLKYLEPKEDAEEATETPTAAPAPEHHMDMGHKH